MKKNLFLTAISIGSRLLSGLLIFVLLARLWGPAQFGTFAFIFSASSLLVLMVDFGFSGYLLREIGAQPDRARHLIGVSLWAKASLILLYLLGSGITYIVAGAAALPLEMFVPLLLSMLAFSFADFFIAPLRALGRYGVETSVVTLSNLFHFILVASVAWFVGTPVAVAWAFASGRIVLLTVSAVVANRTIPGIFQAYCGMNTLVRTLRNVVPYGTDGLLTSIWNQVDIVAVRAIYGAQGVGLYAAGQKIVEGAAALAPVVGNVMVPRLSRLHHTSSPHFRGEARTASIMMFTVGCIFGIPLIAFPGQITQVLFGDKYQELASLLPYFALILMLRYLAAGTGIALTALGLQKKRVIGQMCGLTIFGVVMLSAHALPLAITGFLFGYAAAIVTTAAIAFYYLATNVCHKTN